MIMDEVEAQAEYNKLKVDLPEETADPEFQELINQQPRLDEVDTSAMASQPDPFAPKKG